MTSGSWVGALIIAVAVTCTACGQPNEAAGSIESGSIPGTASTALLVTPSAAPVKGALVTHAYPLDESVPLAQVSGVVAQPTPGCFIIEGELDSAQLVFPSGSEADTQGGTVRVRPDENGGLTLQVGEEAQLGGGFLPPDSVPLSDDSRAMSDCLREGTEPFVVFTW